MNDSKTLIQLSHLSKQFQKTIALKDVNVTIQEGEIFGFLGPSGAGKTTTIKILTGQLTPTSGMASILGVNVSYLNHDIYQKIGIVTDNSGLYEKLTVYQNLAFFASLLDIDHHRINELLQKVGLENEQKKGVSKLSKGMKQRLNLARALIHQPKILFLDEPTSGLDPSTASMIHKLLLELRDQGTAIFLTTHNMDEATKLCDQVALLNDGRIATQGSPSELCLQFNQSKKYHVILSDHSEYWLEQNEENRTQINKWMNSNQLEAIHSCEPTLEQVFLTVTGRNLK